MTATVVSSSMQPMDTWSRVDSPLAYGSSVIFAVNASGSRLLLRQISGVASTEESIVEAVEASLHMLMVLAIDVD
ncbi:hypothetical protein, partial [Staphylococcus aureus]|uniref:hypothetical protein n=1 Tax=Staphylococcus aureus TaxID=1280 RepID=UPI003D0D57B0